MVGRPQISDSLKEFNGTLDKSRIRKHVKSNNSKLKPPRHLSDAAKAVWIKLASILQLMQIYTVADDYTIEQFSDAWVIRQRCMAAIDLNGLVYETTNSTGDTMFRPRPEVAILHKTEVLILQLESKLGLSPSDRSRINVVINEDDGSDAKYGDYGQT